jgi:hypothetical protein
MFGCDAFFANLNIYSIIWDGRILLRFPVEARFLAAEALTGSGMFDPMGTGKTMRGWVAMPEELSDDVDALHMLAIADQAGSAEWAAQGVALAEASADPRTHRWLIALHNNLGGLHHDAGRYPELAEFEAADAAARAHGSEDQQRSPNGPSPAPCDRWGDGRGPRHPTPAVLGPTTVRPRSSGAGGSAAALLERGGEARHVANVAATRSASSTRRGQARDCLPVLFWSLVQVVHDVRPRTITEISGRVRTSACPCC